jgi:hypothetical protein
MGTYVQSASTKGAGVANITATLTITAGNLVVNIGGGNNASVYTIGGLTDNKSQVYSITDTKKDATNDQVIMGYHANAASGSTQFKFTPPSSSDCDIVVIEASGADTSSPLGEHSGNIDSTGHSSYDCGTITTTTANGILVCVAVSDGNNTATTQPTGYLKRQEILTVTNMPISAATRSVTATETSHPIFTGADIQQNVGVVALFKDAAGGGGNSYPVEFMSKLPNLMPTNSRL